jgi:glyoxylase-like metal-dependent hydrolase (beta-lactamase superfamily II)
MKKYISGEHHTVLEIAKGIYRIWIPLATSPMIDLDHVNSYLLKSSNGWWIIDVGWKSPDVFQALEDALKSLKIAFTDIETILITHSHPDHYGLAGEIKKLSPQTRILMHKKENELIEPRYINFDETERKNEANLDSHGVPMAEQSLLGSASLKTLTMVTVIHPDLILTGGETLNTGVFNLEVIPTPGHSPGHICFYEPQNQFLFSGDHVLPTITPNISSHILSGGDPLGNYFNSFEKLKSLSVKMVHPGHEVSFPNLNERLKEIREHHKIRGREIYNLLSGNPLSAFEIAKHLTWHVKNQTWEQFNPWIKRMATTEVVAHCEYMQNRGDVRKHIIDNRVYFTLT